MLDHYAAGLAIVAGLALLIWGVRTELRQRQIQAARRRHPSARTTPDFTSDAARKYHESNQLGRN